MPPKKKGVKTGPTHYLVVKAVPKGKSWSFRRVVVKTEDLEKVIKETREEQKKAVN